MTPEEKAAIETELEKELCDECENPITQCVCVDWDSICFECGEDVVFCECDDVCCSDYGTSFCSCGIDPFDDGAGPQ